MKIEDNNDNLYPRACAAMDAYWAVKVSKITDVYSTENTRRWWVLCSAGGNATQKAHPTSIDYGDKEYTKEYQLHFNSHFTITKNMG